MFVGNKRALQVTSRKQIHPPLLSSRRRASRVTGPSPPETPAQHCGASLMGSHKLRIKVPAMTTPSFLDEMLRSATLEDFAALTRRRGPRALPAHRGLASTNRPRRVRQQSARKRNLIFRRVGITFNVYGGPGRHRTANPLRHHSPRLARRRMGAPGKRPNPAVRALNMFLHDIYQWAGRGQSRRVVPEAHLLRNSLFRPEMNGVICPATCTCTSRGIDIVRVEEGTFYVLEDNCERRRACRTCWQNRAVMMRLFPQLFAQARVAPVDHYCKNYCAACARCARQHRGRANRGGDDPGSLQQRLFRAHLPSPNRWAWELAEGQDLSFATTPCTCAPPWARAGWT